MGGLTGHICGFFRGKSKTIALLMDLESTLGNCFET